MSDRRQFMTGAAVAGAGIVGLIGGLYAAKKTWEPLPSVRAGGFTTIDTSSAKENVLYTELWRGKPIFMLKRPKSAKPNDRDIVIDGERFMITVGLCTHLGCIPAYFPDESKFKCACHGGEFDSAGEVLKAPPPRPLDIPPFRQEGKKLYLGETGPEYKKLLDAGLTKKA